MSTKMAANGGIDSTLKSVSKGALTTQVSAITLHQLSIALSQKNRKAEVQYVTLLSFYSLSMNSSWAKPSVHLLCPRLIRKGRTGDALATLCFILSLASRTFIDGKQKRRPGDNSLLVQWWALGGRKFVIIVLTRNESDHITSYDELLAWYDETLHITTLHVMPCQFENCIVSDA